ncbi:sporulation membrane protein YtaF [Desulfothermobacter acidiphilus]|uniref:sporulation membrane protein YtaF n=1 Tax=Desulfothermobacter acidiphilus TaxID=1938353 RepID=UPI003F893B57
MREEQNMEWLTAFLLSVSSSLDNFGAALSYGICGIRIRERYNGLIAGIAFLFSYAGIVGGELFGKLLPGKVADVAAALLFFLVGLRIALLAWQQRRRNQQEERVEVGIGDILRTPTRADLDRSGDLSLWEALLLGVALSLNALVNGLGAGILGLSPFLVSSLAALGSFIAVRGGIALGARLATVRIGRWSLGQFSVFLSGAILVFIGLHNLL